MEQKIDSSLLSANIEALIFNNIEDISFLDKFSKNKNPDFDNNFIFFIPDITIFNQNRIYIYQRNEFLQREIHLLQKMNQICFQFFYFFSKEYNFQKIREELFHRNLLANILFIYKNTRYTSINKIKIEFLIDNYFLHKKEKKLALIGDDLITFNIIKNFYHIDDNVVTLMDALKSIFEWENIFFTTKQQEIFLEIDKIIRNETIHSYILKSVIIFYLIKHLNLEHHLEDKVIPLSLYFFLKNTHFKEILDIGPFFDFFNKHLSFLNNEFKKIEFYAIKNLTSLYLAFIDIFSEIIQEFFNYLNRFIALDLNDKSNSSVRMKKFDLNNFLQNFPELTRKQALFYINNQEKNHYYSIDNFRSFSNSSYETARKAMENLTAQKLYQKIKVGKKFVYKPY